MVADFVIAVDFDGTLERGGDYPVPGAPNDELICMLKDARESGAKLILYTCREGRALAIALQWCSEHDLIFDAINENLPERVELYGNDCRKIGADMYIDDKARTPDMFIDFAKRMKKRTYDVRRIH